MAFKTVGDHGRLLYNTLGGDAYDCPSLNEVQAYLLYRYGLGMAKRKMTESAFYHCKKRAEEIAEEQNGRLD